jgi:hypothetical protein
VACSRIKPPIGLIVDMPRRAVQGPTSFQIPIAQQVKEPQNMGRTVTVRWTPPAKEATE